MIGKDTMTEQILKLKSQKWLNDSTLEMTLVGENLKMKAGQFVELSVDGFFLRRPISVGKCQNGELTLIYKVVGQGTKAMSKWQAGKEFSVLCDLGNGFDLSTTKKPLLVGGGIGVAPLLQTAIELNQKGIKPIIVLGFRNKEEVVLEKEFQQLGELVIATDDGSFGEKGNAVSVLQQKNFDFDEYFACGPMIMLKYLTKFSTKGYVSLEARMGCGFGACMGCSIQTTKGNKRVCKEGPVFRADEVIFEGEKA